MGFSYKDWNGFFYPADMAARNYLAYYSRVFKAVEIDSTFYGTPKANTVERWAANTPEGFRFCVKTPRAITHDLGLEASTGLMHDFTTAMRGLGNRLGVILLQFPPSFHIDQLSTLKDFLGGLPEGFRYALEVRHQSWHLAQEAVSEMLAEAGVCWAATEYPGLPARILVTTDFLYVRWIGQHGAFESHTRERIDRSQHLQAWWEGMQTRLDAVTDVYGFFNNDYAGFAAGTANRFKEIAGLPREPLTPAQQGKLFE